MEYFTIFQTFTSIIHTLSLSSKTHLWNPHHPEHSGLHYCFHSAGLVPTCSPQWTWTNSNPFREPWPTAHLQQRNRTKTRSIIRPPRVVKHNLRPKLNVKHLTSGDSGRLPLEPLIIDNRVSILPLIQTVSQPSVARGWGGKSLG